MISVILPAFNEAERLPPTLADIEVYCKKYPHIVDEVILIDDGSTDAGKTVERAMYYSTRLPLKVDRFAVNQGKWAAIHKGIEIAKNDWVLLLDADGSATIWELEKVRVQEIIQLDAAVFGSRFVLGAVVTDKAFIRNIISRGYRFYSQALLRYASGRTDIDDLQAPWKLFRKSAVKGKLKVNRFCGDFELACKLKMDVRIHPLRFCHKGGSKLPVLSMFQMAWQTFCLALDMRKRRLYKAK